MLDASELHRMKGYVCICVWLSQASDRRYLYNSIYIYVYIYIYISVYINIYTYMVHCVAQWDTQVRTLCSLGFDVEPSHAELQRHSNRARWSYQAAQAMVGVCRVAGLGLDRESPNPDDTGHLRVTYGSFLDRVTSQYNK